ncbi:MAG TPA: M48 family metallopeptidase [Gemmatimonadales bacterium]
MPVRTSRMVITAAGLALLASCAISQQQEVEMGAGTAAQVSAELPLIRDAQVVNYITALGNQLARATDLRDLTWQFTVVDSKEVNAFAVPGGWVYVNRGLIERATNMSEVAGVLAHEIGHITRRHSVQQLQQAQGANAGLLLMCTLTKVCESGAGQAAINVGGSALFAKFSRTDEAEADAEAVATTIKAGISPAGIPSMFRTLLAARQSSPGAVDAFFASHPLEENRIRDTEALIAAYPVSQLRGLPVDTQAFQTFRRRLQSLPPSPTPKQPSG